LCRTGALPDAKEYFQVDKTDRNIGCNLWSYRGIRRVHKLLTGLSNESEMTFRVIVHLLKTDVAMECRERKFCCPSFHQTCHVAMQAIRETASI